MDKSVLEFFNCCRSNVSQQDIVDFAPQDPGYDNYVQVWTEILSSGEIPEVSSFDIAEVIGLTGFANPAEEVSAERFLKFRRFTSSLGVALINKGIASDVVRPPNYLARDLLVDTVDCDLEVHELLYKVFSATRNSLFNSKEEIEYPFFTFGEIVLGQRLNDYQSCAKDAAQLIDDEAFVRNEESYSYLVQSDEFLLGITNFDQFHKDWKELASALSNPVNDENLELIIQSI